MPGWAPAVLPAVYSPAAVMAPPVAVQVTAGVVDDPSLHEPDTVNCWVPPGARDTEDGLRTSCVSVGGGTAMVTALVSALVPPVSTAITRYVPAVLPAVERPLEVMAPPGGVQGT